MAKKRRKKKSYNPFTMWGSYIGALFGMSINLLCYPVLKNYNTCDFFWTFEMLNTNLGLYWFMGLTLSGFLAGWGIHSLIRRYS